MLSFGVTIPVTVPQRSEIPEGLMNNPVYETQSCEEDNKADSSIATGTIPLRMIKVNDRSM
jgi:hypothetical protein